jgi:hypothetical protein
MLNDMEKFSLNASGTLDRARTAHSGRSASAVYGHEHTLRQTLIALSEDRVLDEHENPGEVTDHVPTGLVRHVAN